MCVPLCGGAIFPEKAGSASALPLTLNINDGISASNSPTSHHFQRAHGVYGYHTRLALHYVSMREVPGSIPGVSSCFLFCFVLFRATSICFSSCQGTFAEGLTMLYSFKHCHQTESSRSWTIHKAEKHVVSYCQSDMSIDGHSSEYSSRAQWQSPLSPHLLANFIL